MRFNFIAFNNEAEYAALLCVVQMCEPAGDEETLALSDSQLISSKVNGKYEAIDSTVIKYLEAVHQEILPLKNFEVRQIPRYENNKDDSLSKLAISASRDTPHHVLWEVKHSKSIDAVATTVLDRTSTWLDDIINFKMNRVLSEDQKQEANNQKRSS